jgi:outer membrane protein OmpA-like peptidoglycan-associated protein
VEVLKTKDRSTKILIEITRHQTMKQLSYASSMIILLLAVSTMESREAFADNFGQWSSSSTNAWKTGAGECWHSSGATNADCGGVMMAEPVSMPAPVVRDSDGDGVIDENDDCWNTPAGVTVKSNGCGIDSDGDGVPDHLDQCAETPLGTVVYTDGCPMVIARLEGIHFAFDSAKLTSEAKSILDNASASSAAHITVEGHTDSTGSDSYNYDLSQRRAQSVVDYLGSNGVSTSRMDAVGKGASSPIASNDTSDGRARNRRVEVIAK